MKIIFTLILYFLSFLIATAQQDIHKNAIKQNTPTVTQADPSQIITTTDPAFLKKRNIEVKQADPSQIVTVTDPAYLKSKNTAK